MFLCYLLVFNLNQIQYYSNIILIAGAGRNVGKTTFACKIIESLSDKHDVTAVKVSSHLHALEHGTKILFQSQSYALSKEESISKKDSSRMLEAGAKNVYYLQSQQENLKDAFEILKPHIQVGPVIIESGGLHQIIKPALFFFVYKDTDIAENKKTHLKFDPIPINFNRIDPNFHIDKIRYTDQGFLYK
jgi:hypothetical protein